MAKYMVAALANPVEGKEDQFNDWYDNVAIPSFQRIPGLTHLGRFRHHSRGDDSAMPTTWEYASFYEIETDDFDSYLQTAKNTLADIPEYSLSEFLDRTTWFEPIYKALPGTER